MENADLEVVEEVYQTASVHRNNVPYVQVNQLPYDIVNISSVDASRDGENTLYASKENFVMKKNSSPIKTEKMQVAFNLYVGSMSKKDIRNVEDLKLLNDDGDAAQAEK
jgi:hypothetical protein